MTYELLTGYLPFDENNPVTLRTKIIKGDYTRPSILLAGISPRLDTLIEKSLRVQAANRITARQAVQLFSSQHTVTVQEKQTSLFTKQNLWAAGFVLAGFILLMAFINTRQPSIGEQGISNDSVYTPVKKNLVGDEKNNKNKYTQC